MDLDRPHRTTSTPTTTSELFICFTSRLSHSSSMRLSSKSILSPGRGAAGEKSSSITSSSSLTTSISRRLRHNGSLRGAQSPAMFPTKKSRGSSAFNENPEPSSPKVTCIGQVRVKTKKQGKKMKMRACRSKRISGGEASFRRIDTQPLQGQESVTGLAHQTSSQGMVNNINNGGSNVQQECSRNQRWVHLPLTICEALRTFGSEFSCLLPCKSSCFSSSSSNGKGGEKGEEKESGVSSCGAVFRWLVAMQEGEGEEGKRRDIELIVDDEVEERDRGRVMERECSRRRSIFDDMEFDDLFVDSRNNDNNDDVKKCDEIEEPRGSVSVCVPPKNALLLMRCRSDPVRMASLSQKFWEPPLVNDDDDEEDEEVVGEKVVSFEEKSDVLEEKSEVVEEKSEVIEERLEVKEESDGGFDGMCEDWEVVEPKGEDLAVFVEDEVQEKEEEVVAAEDIKGEEVVQKEEEEEQETGEIQSVESRGAEAHEDGDIVEARQVMEDDIVADGCSTEAITVDEEVQDGENAQDLANCPIVQCNEELVENDAHEEEIEQDLVEDDAHYEGNVQDLVENDEHSQRNVQDLDNIAHNQGMQEACDGAETESSDLSSSNYSTSSDASEEESTAESKELEEHEEKDSVQEVRKSMDKEGSKVEEKQQQKTSNKPMLPDCLLLMMCEPKLSMEVSKETWVCSTDFMRWLPERHSKQPTKTDGSDESAKKKKMADVVAKPPLYQPPVQRAVQPGRSSISFPAGGGTVANLIEQKLAKAGVGYEPFVLTRCKSAPMRSTAKIAAPELACSMWGRENGRNLEPHRPATCGVGTAGIGF